MVRWRSSTLIVVQAAMHDISTNGSTRNTLCTTASKVQRRSSRRSVKNSMTGRVNDTVLLNSAA
jgi:hypothetical protein